MSRDEAIYELKKSLWWVMEKILEGWVTEDGSKCEIDWDGFFFFLNVPNLLNSANNRTLRRE